MKKRIGKIAAIVSALAMLITTMSCDFGNEPENEEPTPVTKAQVATPAITVADNTVTITTTTDGASIYYTTDGTAPSAESTAYTAPFALTATVTVKAIAIAEGYDNSEIAEKKCEYVKPVAATPVITNTDNSVTITSETEGAVIYYTLDGTEPTAESTKYEAAFAITKDTTVKAIATKDGYTDSDVAEEALEYVAPGSVGTPKITQDGNTVTITCATTGATIYYTTDGTAPTTASTKYTAAFAITANVTVKAIAVKADCTDSAVAEKACKYTAPVAAKPVITFANNTVTITTTTEGADIYYTLDGSAPSASSTKYTAAFDITETKTVKAIAVKEGYTNSEAAEQACTYVAPAAAGDGDEDDGNTGGDNPAADGEEEVVNTPTTKTVTTETNAYSTSTHGIQAKISLRDTWTNLTDLEANDSFKITMKGTASRAFTPQVYFMDNTAAGGYANLGAWGDTVAFTTTAFEITKTISITKAPTSNENDAFVFVIDYDETGAESDIENVTLTFTEFSVSKVVSGEIWSGETVLDWEDDTKRVTIDHSKFTEDFAGIKVTFTSTGSEESGGSFKVICSDPWTVLTLTSDSVSGDGGPYSEASGETPVGVAGNKTDGTITILFSAEQIALIHGEGVAGKWGGLTIMGANSITLTKVELVTE